MNIIKAAASIGIVAMLIAAPELAMASSPNILVVTEDADIETVPRNNRIHNRVIQAIQEEMNVRGFSVYDETAVGMTVTTPNRVRRKDAELIEVARSIPNPPLDVMVIFQIYASAKKGDYSDIRRPEVRIPGRMLNVSTGQLIGSFEVSGFELPPLPLNCDRTCLLEKVGDEARTLGRDLAVVLSEKLSSFVSAGTAPTMDGSAGGSAVTTSAMPTKAKGCAGLPSAYVLEFDNFSADQVTQIEEYIAAFKCYDSYRPVRVSGTYAEYWYETSSDSARLNRNLRLMLKHMDVKGTIQMGSNKIRVSRIATR